MAATISTQAISDVGDVTGALASYLRSGAEPNLYRNYEFLALATEAEIPAGQGIHMNIPAYTNGVSGATWSDKANALSPVVAANEINPLLGGTTADQSLFRTTTVTSVDRKQTYFADGFAVSKLYKNTATVQGEFERIAQFIMKTAAATQEILLQSNIIYEFNSGGASTDITDPTNTGVIWNTIGAAEGATAGEPLYVSPTPAGTAWGSVGAGELVVANKFALARKYLKQRGNPGFQNLGGRLAALVGPDTIYALSTQVTAVPAAGATGHAALTFENDSMDAAGVFTDGRVAGDLFGFRLIETNNPIVIPGAETNGPSKDLAGAAVECEVNVLFAPDAFYITPHANLTPQLYMSGFNEGGPLNPTKSLSSLATDFTFGALRGPDFENKLLLLPTTTV